MARRPPGQTLTLADASSTSSVYQKLPSACQKLLRKLVPWGSGAGTPVDVHVLRAVWALVVLWYEYGTFWWSVVGCRWPDGEWRGTPSLPPPTHILLIADPQVLDHRSYPGRAQWLMRLTQFIVDLNLRKSWKVTRRLRPDVVVFLGDMMDNGRFAVGDPEYEEYVQRFRDIFALDSSIPVYYIPGNHDVGLGTSKKFSPRARQRYIEHFGPVNQHLSIANHTFVMIDAPGLVEEDYLRAKAGLDFEHWRPPKFSTVQFIKDYAKGDEQESEEPVILLTHIPLHRPERATCGPLRERGSIRKGVGYGYQNTLGKLTTEFVLRNVKPSLIFSGDDHDYCEYTHVIPSDEENLATGLLAPEITVKSFSMAMGVQHPGFQLLSLVTPSPSLEKSFAHTPCTLPDQVGIYLSKYIPLVVMTLLYLVVVNLISRFRRGDLDGTKHSRGFSKYLNELRTDGLTSSSSAVGDRGLRPPNSPRLSGYTTPTFRQANVSNPQFLNPNSPTLRSSFRMNFEDDMDSPVNNRHHDDGYYSDEETTALQSEIPTRPPLLPLPGATSDDKNSKFRLTRPGWSWSRFANKLRNPAQLWQEYSPTLFAASRTANTLHRRRINGRPGVRGLFTVLILDMLSIAWCPILLYLFITYSMYH